MFGWLFGNVFHTFQCIHIVIADWFCRRQKISSSFSSVVPVKATRLPGLTTAANVSKQHNSKEEFHPSTI